MRDYHPMTALSFMQSYDADVMHLQDDPIAYIVELEAELERCHPLSLSYDNEGNKVWPIGVLKAHAQIEGEPLWEYPSAAL